MTRHTWLAGASSVKAISLVARIAGTSFPVAASTVLHGAANDRVKGWGK